MIDSRMGAYPVGRVAAARLLACLCAAAILFTAALALAQQQPNPPPPAGTAARHPRAWRRQPRAGLLGQHQPVVEQQAANLKSSFSGAASGGKIWQKARQDADDAAKSTVSTVKDAAGAVIRIPNTRLVNGNEPCALLPTARRIAWPPLRPCAGQKALPPATARPPPLRMSASPRSIWPAATGDPAVTPKLSSPARSASKPMTRGDRRRALVSASRLCFRRALL